MKLANWNLERAATPTRRRAQREQVDLIGADIWVFTETHAAFDPGLPYSCFSTAERDGIRGLDTLEDHWVAIWSRWKLEPLPTSDPVRTAAARITPGDAPPFIVFGLVLPWTRDHWRGFSPAGGEAFRQALKLQQSDWLSLRRSFPEDEFFLLGDFNQDLVEPRYYGSCANREALIAALAECDLHALTGGAGDPIRRDSVPWACIDHICARKNSRWKPAPAIRWPATPRPDKRLSDHFGVAVTLA